MRFIYGDLTETKTFRPRLTDATKFGIVAAHMFNVSEDEEALESELFFGADTDDEETKQESEEEIVQPRVGQKRKGMHMLSFPQSNVFLQLHGLMKMIPLYV